MKGLLLRQRRAALAAYGLRASGKRSFILPNLSALTSASTDVQTYHERKILPYDRKQLYDIVADVPSYHRFIPYCTSSRVISDIRPANAKPHEPTEMDAELKVGFMSFEETYVSKVECTPYKMVRATASSETPLFKSLATTWSFAHASPASPHPSQTTSLPSVSESSSESLQDTLAGPTLLTIDLAYAFANPLHAALAASFFDKITGKMVNAFERRCLDVYGPGKR